jgi:hypothetical protein
MSVAGCSNFGKGIWEKSPTLVPALEKLAKYYKITGNSTKEKDIVARIAQLQPAAD